MHRHHPDIRPGARRALVLLAVGLAGAGTLGACGSSHSSTALLGSAMQRQCVDVANVLSDGPDPTADPVGYAEAQPRDLDELSLPDKPLATAVHGLANAYEAYYRASAAAGADSPSGAAASAVTAAGRRVDAICPGATS